MNIDELRIEMRSGERCLVDDAGVVAVFFADGGGEEARRVLNALRMRPVIDELIAKNVRLYEAAKAIRANAQKMSRRSPVAMTMRVAATCMAKPAEILNRLEPYL